MTNERLLDINQALVHIDLGAVPTSAVELYQGTADPDQRETILNRGIVSVTRTLTEDLVVTPQSIRGLMELYREGHSNVASYLTSENLVAIANALVVGEPEPHDHLLRVMEQIEEAAGEETAIGKRADLAQDVVFELTSRLNDHRVPVSDREQLLGEVQELALETIRWACQDHPDFLMALLENVEELTDDKLRAYILMLAAQQIKTPAQG